MKENQKEIPKAAKEKSVFAEWISIIFAIFIFSFLFVGLIYLIHSGQLWESIKALIFKLKLDVAFFGIVWLFYKILDIFKNHFYYLMVLWFAYFILRFFIKSLEDIFTELRNNKNALNQITSDIRKIKKELGINNDDW